MGTTKKKKKRQADRVAKIQNDMEAVSFAEKQTQLADSLQISLDHLLLSNLHPQGLLIDEFKDFSEFSEPCPKKPELEELPPEPQISDKKYHPNPSFFTKIFKAKMEEFTQNNIARFEMDHDAWEKLKKDIEELNLSDEQKYQDDLSSWESRKKEFEQKQSEQNEKADMFFGDFQQRKPEAVERYFALVLEKITFPFDYSISSEIEYNSDSKLLVVDLFLPTINDLPNRKSVSYIKSKKNLKKHFKANHT